MPSIKPSYSEKRRPLDPTREGDQTRRKENRIFFDNFPFFNFFGNFFHNFFSFGLLLVHVSVRWLASSPARLDAMSVRDREDKNAGGCRYPADSRQHAGGAEDRDRSRVKDEIASLFGRSIAACCHGEKETTVHDPRHLTVPGIHPLTTPILGLFSRGLREVEGPGPFGRKRDLAA